MLIKEIAQKYGAKVKFVSENWGESKLADYYGITRYPVVFVDDLLIAQPDDFGWYGAKGKYTPWRDAANHAKFKNDLSKMIDLILSGHKAAAEKPAARLEALGPAALPTFTAHDMDGKQIDFAALNGKVLIVEFWATWCVPCRATLKWFNEIKQRYGERVELIAVAVESPEKEVRQMTATLNPMIHKVFVNDAIIKNFGDITSVPTMYVFDRTGKTANVFFGAPPDLHQKVTGLMNALLK
ncbi:MAG: TlpA disulfide reductase family protein [Acidobacteriota bacterium]